MADFKMLAPMSEFDLQIEHNDIATDDGLDNAVLMSLFLDARVGDDEELPPGETDRRGWWGDEFSEGPHGSKLWLLDREKRRSAVLPLAKTLTEEALAWLVSEQVASAVNVESLFEGSLLVLDITIDRPGEESARYRYGLNWNQKAEANGLG